LDYYVLKLVFPFVAFIGSTYFFIAYVIEKEHQANNTRLPTSGFAKIIMFIRICKTNEAARVNYG